MKNYATTGRPERRKKYRGFGLLWKIKPEFYNRVPKLEERMGYVFARRELLFEALTHRSALADIGKITQDDLEKREWNERLEFLGDSVLGLVVSERLMSLGSGLSEGEMSKIRSAIVCEENLIRVAQDKLGLGEYLVVGGSVQGAVATTLAQGSFVNNLVDAAARQPGSMIANALEAVIGAVFLDAGWDAVKRVVAKWFADDFAVDARKFLIVDAKTRLQEFVQAKFKMSPTYVVTGEVGLAHQRSFQVSVKIGERELAQGFGVSKKEAAKNAAKNALKRFAEVAL